MNEVWVVEWVCYPYISDTEERGIEKVCKSKEIAIEWCNSDEDFENNFLVVGEDPEKVFDRYRDSCLGHYEISCWDIL